VADEVRQGLGLAAVDQLDDARFSLL
jgi:hypothetical protein